jgi:ribonuclease HI
MDKYLGSINLCDWLRKPTLLQKSASPFWKGMVNSSPIILHWLRWKPGTGKKIKIGRDMIVGLEDRSLLHPVLCSKLTSQNILYLAQINLPTGSSTLPDQWMGSSELSLIGQRALEWNQFTLELKLAGLSLSQEPDTILWTGGDGSGIPSVKNIFDALQDTLSYAPDLSWRPQAWKWRVPLKHILFVWLASKNRILTWDSLRRKGWEGPGLCPLCRRAQEDSQHLLIHCVFTKDVWSRIIKHLKLSTTWSGDTITDCFSSWLSNKALPIPLAVYTCWHLWTERNNALFENRSPSRRAVFHRVLASFSWQPTTLTHFIHKEIDLSLPEGYNLACFDGAAQANGSCCGAGGFYRAIPSRITKWMLNCGPGTNTKAELMGLWVSLLLASWWSINHLIVRGDSKVIIDWISKKSNLRAIHVDSWKQKSMDLANGFSNVRFQHISRVYNREADALSKRALKEEAGVLSIYHSDSGVESPITTFSIF